MPVAGIRVKTDVDRALLRLRREVLAELRPALMEIGGLVKDEAQKLAGADIENIGLRWQRMRVGVTTQMVYVVPASRRRGGSPRPNLGGLLLTKALEPAVDKHQDEAVRRLTALVDGSAALAGLL